VTVGQWGQCGLCCVHYYTAVLDPYTHTIPLCCGAPPSASFVPLPPLPS
jgi:hypothetical protein